MNLLKKYVFTQTFIYPLLIGILSVILILANYTPGTFLTGWDTLHPEFNFPLAFNRMLDGVWRTDQGLGTVAIQSHMADLPRIVILWVLSFIAPLNSLRYITMLTPLLIGPLGIYFLTGNLLKNKNVQKTASFLGALFYLCNLVVVQQFVVPLEMFTFHYAFLPWVFLFILKFIQEGKKRNFLLFALFSILLIPQAHTATLFYTYFMGISLSLLAYLLLNRSKSHLKKIIVILLSILFINSYWLLPNIYTISSQGKEVRESQINRYFSNEAFAKNQAFGTIKDVAIGKNFLFDWQLYNPKTNSGEDVLSSWENHFKNPFIVSFGYLIFFVSLFGLGYALFKRNKKLLIFTPITVVSTLMLLNGTWPINLIFEFISEVSPTLKESLRFPFTKFSILYIFGLSIFFTEGVRFILEKIRLKLLQFMLAILITAGFIFYFLPGFSGNLLQPAMKVAIPNEYFQMFSYFQNKDKNERIALLPAHSFWGWAYYSWGYQGAGFLQFGIPQPLLDPDHNRWSKYNEQYYREMQYAIYNQSPQQLENILSKYNIQWIIFDESLLSVSGQKSDTLSWYIPEFLKKSDNIKLVKTFGKDIKIYEYTKAKKSHVSAYKSLPDIGPNKLGALKDYAYSSIGAYLTKNNAEIDTEKQFTTFDGRYIGELKNFIIYTTNAYSKLSPIKDCSNGKSDHTRTVEDGVIKYESKNGPLCDHFSFPELSHNKAYIVQITSRNVQGFPLELYICNNLTFHCDQVYHLTPAKNFIKEAFVIPSYLDNGEGYTLNINNFSIKGRSSINELQEISVREYTPDTKSYKQKPGEFLGSFDSISSSQGKNSYKISHILNPGTTLVYDERFHTGWHAYTFENEPNFIEKTFPFWFGNELKDHVLVNNWANGWVIDKASNDKQIIIVFLPQYLEYAGFALLLGFVGVTGVILLKSKIKRQN